MRRTADLHPGNGKTTVELTPRGRVVATIAAIALLVGWITDRSQTRIVAAALVAPLLAGLLLKQRRLHDVDIRVGARRCIVGQPFLETVSLQQRGSSSLRECALSEPRTMRKMAPALLPLLPAGEPLLIDVWQTSPQRSHIVERVFVLMSQWPLGLLRSRAVIRVATDFVTEPARVALRGDLLHCIAHRDAAIHDRMPSRGSEFHSLRDHLPDEDVRGVHARRSAAVGSLVRRVTQGVAPQTVGIVLDLRRPPNRGRLNHPRRLEWSLGACATLLQMLRRIGATARVVVLDEQPVELHVASPAQQQELLTLLAEASTSLHHAIAPDLLDGLRQLAHCYWIPAGSYLAAPEFAAMGGRVTLVGGDLG